MFFGVIHPLYITSWDDYSKSLYLKLLLTDELENVRSNSAYPQFELSHNPADDLHIQFNYSRSCYLTQEDTTLIITNLSKKYGLRLREITCYGAQLHFAFDQTEILEPGESMEIPMDGAISNAKRLYAPVIIDYYHCGTVCLPKTRTFGVSVVGGTEDVPDTGTSEIMCPAVYTILLRLMRAVLRAFLPG